jgi:hypothetical protein
MYRSITIAVFIEVTLTQSKCMSVLSPYCALYCHNYDPSLSGSSECQSQQTDLTLNPVNFSSGAYTYIHTYIQYPQLVYLPTPHFEVPEVPEVSEVPCFLFQSADHLLFFVYIMHK